MDVRGWWAVFRDAAVGWWDHAALRFSASLAYYTVVSLAPFMIFVVGLAAVVFGADAARDQVVAQVSGLVGPDGAAAVKAVIDGARDSESGVAATLLGVAALLVGVTGVFLELQTALNALWDVEPKPGKDTGAFVRARALSFALVLGVGFLLLVSLVASAALAATASVLSDWRPGLQALWRAGHAAASFAATAGLFALMFKYLPDARVAWRDVAAGAVLTAALFTVGKGLIGLYLGNSGLGSAYGAAGSVVVLMVWLYYSAAIVLFGAEVTRAYARHFGAGVAPAPQAVRVA